MLRDLAPVEREVETKDGRWLMMRLRPYRTVEDRIDGVVVTFVDITARREAEERLRQSEERYRRLFESMDEGYLLVEVIRDEAGKASDLRCLDANPAAFRLVKADVKGRLRSEVGPGFEAEWWELSARVLESGQPEHAQFHAEPLECWFEIGVAKINGKSVAILFQDITERKRHESERELMMTS